YLLIIPVGESVLYAQPLFLQARSQAGALPELRRVILASSERVVMRPTLAEALVALTAGSEAVAELETPEETAPVSPIADDATIAELANAANEAFDRGQAALATGDWETFGEAQAELERILEQMMALDSGASEDIPAATPAAGT
ncbi:MAG: UPF0182 family protein, partial [Thermomicrobiales bacterium]